MKTQDGSLSRLAQELLAAERSAPEPASLKARALARARRAHDADRLSGIAPKAMWDGRLVASRGRAAMAIAATLAIAGIAAAGVAFSVAQAPSAAPAAFLNPALRPVQRQPSQAVGRAALAAEPAVAAPVEPSASPRRNAPRASSARQYALELELLEPARVGVARGDYGRALEAIARHRREFPGGQLAEERAALHVRALSGLGRAAEAEAATAAFRQRYPKSALLGARSRTP